ncbi:MAG: dipicolinate synthase subunit B [Defluviitaleaceae bacterium]|nr:dipicolinate synthase subunit B [Defluviitaleaceae bacterium]
MTVKTESFNWCRNKRIGFALTGSFCTTDIAVECMAELASSGAILTPILSDNMNATDTKFGTCASLKEKIAALTPTPIISTIVQAEPIGPGKLLDALVILPATGNTIAKIAAGIADTAVTMAAKSHLRNGRPLILAVSSNDALGLGAKNIGLLLAARNIYFVPFGQDNAIAKPRSLVFKKEFLLPAVEAALQGEQFQPLLA